MALQEFENSYNDDLARLRCPVRVRIAEETWQIGSLEMLDGSGQKIGLVPHDVEPAAMAAFWRIIEQRYEDGVRLGRQAPGRN